MYKNRTQVEQWYNYDIYFTAKTVRMRDFLRERKRGVRETEYLEVFYRIASQLNA